MQTFLSFLLLKSNCFICSLSPFIIYNKWFATWHQFDVSFSYNQGRKKKKQQQQHYNTLYTLTHGLGQRWHQYMTDHSSISRVHTAPLVICTASCHSTQLLAVSLLHLSFFSFCPTFSVLFILLTKRAPASKTFLSWLMWSGGENRLNKEEKEKSAAARM